MLFILCRIFRLKINMRTAPDQEILRNWLEEIGNGLNLEEGKLSIPDEIIEKSLDGAISFCFPPQLFEDPFKYASIIADNAILSPTNNDVDAINEIALERLPCEHRTFLSVDGPLGSNDYATYAARSDFNLECIHAMTPTGMPSHELRLKIGSAVILIRNLDVPRGLCNGTRMQVLSMSNDFIKTKILTGPRADTKHEFLIPRVKFEYGTKKNHRGLKFTRLQFPLRLCFAMTINKVSVFLFS